MTRLFGKVHAFLIGIAIFIVPCTSADAFDAGYHFDLTRVVLKDEGLGTDAIDSISLANWLTDYYSTAPVIKNLLLKAALNRLHFDNLENRDAIHNYHSWFLQNLRELVEEAAQENDRIKMLVVIGIGHHVIQDFYAHSNWADVFPRKADGRFEVNLLSTQKSTRTANLRTGTWPGQGEFAHGNYASGLNKDSHVRPGWETAFVLAHAATRDITNQIKLWAETKRPGFWQHLAQLNLTQKNREELLRDLTSAHDVSMSVRAKVLGLPASDGHWKGNLSGDSDAFSASTNRFIAWKNSFLTSYYRESNIAVKLARRLDKPNPPQLAGARNSQPFSGKAIVVKIHAFRLEDETSNLEKIGARVIINGETYLGRIFSRQTQYRLEGVPAWHEIHIEADKPEIQSVEIQLFAYQKEGKRIETPLDINEAPEKTHIHIDLTGKPGSSDVSNTELPTVVDSFGSGENAAGIRYSIEVHDIV
ncbi:MAG: hypothetical protein AAGA53_11240 [Pseudomonadota bacterium]